MIALDWILIIIGIVLMILSEGLKKHESPEMKNILLILGACIFIIGIVLLIV